MGTADAREMNQSSRRAVLAAGVVAPVAALASCTGSGGGGDGSKDAAAKLAAALQSGHFAGSPVTGQDVDTSYAAVVRGLAATAHTVRVVKVTPGASKSSKTVMLATQWTLAGGRRWTYDQQVTMTSTAKKWTTPWSSTLVHPQLRTGEHLTAASVAQDRGEITDDNGDAIVTYRPVYRVGIDKTKAAAATATASATKLAAVVGVDAASYAKSVAASGPSAFVEAIVLRTQAVTAAEAARIRAIPGAVLITDRRPLAPSATFARAVLGTVGPATAEIVKNSKGTKDPVTATDLVGIGGLQQQYDAQLRGSAALRISAVLPGASGPQSVRTLASLGAVAPKPLRTTLRQDLQTTAESLLKAQKSPSALVAIRPSTGEVLVAASGAGSQGYDTAFLGRYAPGSTFKVVSSLALLRSGLKITDTVDCTPTISVQGRIVKNFPDYPKDKLGMIPFKTAVANSCNTVMIRGADRASQSSLAVAADSLGLTQNPSDGPFFGSVPPGDAGADHQVSMIGQGRVLASPLGMATVAASVAHGARVTPYVLPDHKPTVSKQPTTPLTAAETTSLRALMRAVVTEGGATGLQSVPGGPVMAKTGTAEYGTGNPPQTHSWMIAFQGDLAIAVFVETGGYGGVTCLPIVKSFLTAAGKA
ncbi:penicillin-binding transpeptidase domain-containing protein [Allobranchiibius sp. CTAmp26]|uniref:penicillin-binding transpeptidase domain-containing protein n=1 Tax=Allobranchiibius sp. CTAmp26 TaxID=2815214 RepID=UPI001AA18E4F|nr:penicillin-binding transpeptidase domain-containing protein [Allobranchiibius sp. CTAmp26]MBO1756694.1 penicillin-binding protein [Allobranchiibius sp. CTAmp26]